MRDTLTNTWNPSLYDRRHSFVWQHAASLIELLAPQPGERILDLGCGTGHLTAEIAATGALVIGIDNSQSMLDQARTSYPALRFECADVREFHFDDAFDAVFSNAALHWVKEAGAVLSCVHQSLRDGGRFVAEFGGKGNVRRIEQALVDEARCCGVSLDSPLWFFPSIAEYSKLLEENGLEPTHAELFDRPTDLEGEHGMRAWVEMFGQHVLDQIAAEHQPSFLDGIERRLAPHLCRAGQWIADYRRIRIVARKRSASLK